MSNITKYGEFREGLVLCTKDGRKIGNAIILGIELVTETNDEYCKGSVNIKIETDFGNVLTVRPKYIIDNFYIVPGYIQSIDAWRCSKIRNSARFLYGD